MALDTTKTAHEIITSGRSTGQTVIDSDGNLKWAIENLYRNGAGGVQAITVVSGVDYTIRAASGSIAYSGAATGTLDASAGVSRVEVTASTTTLTITPTDATEIAVYRSDLAGMQFDKYGSDYLPNTTGAALYGLGIDYSTGRGGLQVYEARTNLNPHFEVSTDNWISVADATLEDQTLNVLGTFRGCKVTNGVPVNGAVVSPTTGTLTSGDDYVLTVLWSDTTTDGLYIRVNEASVGSSSLTLTTAGVLAQTASTKGPCVLLSHRDLGGGLYLSSIKWTPNFTGTGSFALGPKNGADGDSVILYAGQFEAGASPSPLIPTYGATVTRGADNLSTLVSSFGYNVNAGTIVADFVTPGTDGADFPRVWQLATSDSNNNTRATVVANPTFSAEVVDDSVTQAALSLNVLVPNVPTKIAMSFATDDFSASQDGSAVVVDASGTLPATFARILYGKSATGDRLNGLIYSIAYYPFAASDAQLVEASS